MDAVVAVVGHCNAAVGAKRDIGQAVELPLTRAMRPECVCERAVGVEDLNAGAALVGHHDAAVGADGEDRRGCGNDVVVKPKDMM